MISQFQSACQSGRQSGKKGRPDSAPLPVNYGVEVTPLGVMMVGATERGICFLQFGEAEVELLAALRRAYPQAGVGKGAAGSGAELECWMGGLTAYLRGESGLPHLPLDLHGTPFQIEVWEFLRTIPAGETVSYGQVAGGIGRPGATRAVASACARNTIALAVPCHRVIRGSGDLAGYRWGIARKRQLLALESRA